MSRRPAAILLAGVVVPAAAAYAALVEALGPDVDARPKELELYAADAPPDGYGLTLEVEGLLRAADEWGLETFHLVGYSGGGAVSLVAATTAPERLESLTLLEPAWSGWDGLEPPERAAWEGFDTMRDAPPDELMRSFVRAQLRPGVEAPPPPAGPQPAWMAKRPAGIRAIQRAFRDAELDRTALARFDRPVLYVLGGRSNPDLYERPARRLARLFPDFTCEVFEERHHFDPPHRIEPERLAALLRAHWHRAGEPSRVP